MTRSSAAGFVREYGLIAYLPTTLFAAGLSLLVPLVPELAAACGLDAGGAAIVAALLVVAQGVGNIPASSMVRRLGERRTMVIAASLAVVGAVLTIVGGVLVLLVLGFVLIGAAAAVFNLARHALMAIVVAPVYRGRALSMLGGSHRVGYLIGPVIGAGVVAATGSVAGAAATAALFFAAPALLVMFAPDPEESLGRRPPEPEAERYGIFRTIWRYRGVYATIGLGTAAVAAMRSVRSVLVPLWGAQVLGDPVQVSLVFALGSTAEVALFYLGGQMMDRYPRFWTAVPSTVLMAASFVVMALAAVLPLPAAWYIAGVVALGIGNGLSSGLLLTLSTDNAPPGDASAFFGGWRLVADLGGAVVPAVVSVLIGVLGLLVATLFAGLTGFAGAGLLASRLPVRRQPPPP